MAWPKRIEAPCRIEGCGKPFKALDLCAMHYKRLKRHGDPSIVKIANDGSGCLESSGYIKMYGTREHILVAEKALGHKLPKGAVVHHVNEIRSDNHPANLVICPNENYHRLLHKRMRVLKRRENGLVT